MTTPSAETPGKDGKEGGEKRPFLLIITGPILRFLSAQKYVQDDNAPIKPIPYWPFGIAGASLFGLGLMGGYAFMSGDVKEETIERERLRGMNVAEKEMAQNRKLAFRTALGRSESHRIPKTFHLK
jgi:hypothetical protein